MPMHCVVIGIYCIYILTYSIDSVGSSNTTSPAKATAPSTTTATTTTPAATTAAITTATATVTAIPTATATTTEIAAPPSTVPYPCSISCVMTEDLILAEDPKVQQLTAA